MPLTLAAVESISPRDIAGPGVATMTTTNDRRLVGPISSLGQQPERPAMIDCQRQVPYPQGGTSRAASSTIATSASSFPVLRATDSVQSQGMEAVNIRSGSGSKSSLAGVIATGNDQDWSATDGAEDPFESTQLFGGRQKVPNVGALKPMQNLVTQFQHNPNQVKQFEELTKTFKAWRPVRGDGNCYYRAVIFAWLERSIGLNLIENLRKFDKMLWPLRQNPHLAVSARLCHQIVDQWIRRRALCESEIEVKTLLLEVTDEFNKTRSDQAFIQCLRHFVADYLQNNADMQVSCGSGAGDVLTYEKWAVAISPPEDGIKNMRDFCNKKVVLMGVDAADHVQHVCPRVLGTAVRICMVDRDSAECQFIDYGECSDMQPKGMKSSGSLTESAFSSGSQPEIYLLLKPGHYDVLLPVADGIARFLGPESNDLLLGSSNRAGPSAYPQNSNTSGVTHRRASDAENHLRRLCDVRWKRLVHLTGNICEAYKAAMSCLEDKLVELLEAKRKRFGSCDDGDILFSSLLTSLMEPVLELLKEFACCPEDSSFSHEKELSQDGFDLPTLLPKIHTFFQAANPALLQAQKPKVVPVHVETVPAKTATSPPPPIKASSLKSVEAASSSSTGKGDECCICLKFGALAVAACRCAYHADCLRDYVADEAKSGKEFQAVCCHIHDKPLGATFLAQHVSSNLLQMPKTDYNLPSTTGLTTQHQLGVPSHQLGDLIRNPPPFRPNAAIGNQRNVQKSDDLLFTLSASNRVQPLLNEAPPRALMSVPPAGQTLNTTRRHSRPDGHILMSGILGASFGVPCVLCFGEDGVLKTLHCGAKVHSKCLKDFWFKRVTEVYRLTHITCPAAEAVGCKEYLNDLDLRGVVHKEDINAAEQQIQRLDAQSQELIAELTRQDEAYRPMFHCAICLTDHEVDGCCELPCQHRFCFESLQFHFKIIVEERRLHKLICPVEDCGFNLRSEAYTYIFQQCLPSQTYHKLLEFLSRDIEQIRDCRHLGCEERVFVDVDDDPADLRCGNGHRFCANCNSGPHPGITCEVRQNQLERERKDELSKRDDEAAWRNALASGWKPCPRRCSYGGGFKASEECDHVTCQCGFEFCWDCGVERQIPLAHDNRWHKPSCRYHTKPTEVEERPRHSSSCPECKKSYWSVCSFPLDDGYPQSYCKR